jgi:hypothetical protein
MKITISKKQWFAIGKQAKWIGSSLSHKKASAKDNTKQSSLGRPCTRSRAWYVKFPADAGAIGPFRFDKEVGEPVVRAKAKEWAGLTRLPQGFECWPTDD